MKDERYHYRDNAIKAAKDLLYPKEVIDKVKAAKTEDEIERIMINARKKYFKDK